MNEPTITVRPSPSLSANLLGRQAAQQAIAAHCRSILENRGVRVRRLTPEIVAQIREERLVTPEDSTPEWRQGAAELLDWFAAVEDTAALHGLGLPAHATLLTVIETGRGRGWQVRVQCGDNDRGHNGGRTVFSDGSKLRCEGARDFLHRQCRMILWRNQSRERALLEFTA